MTKVTAPAPVGGSIAATATTQALSATPGSVVATAERVAAAIRQLPGIAELSPGRGVEAATYGPGRRVVGVVVERSASARLRLAVHVILARHYREDWGARLLAEHGEPGAERRPMLLALADQIRGAAAGAAGTEGLVADVVDVFIDDMQ